MSAVIWLAALSVGGLFLFALLLWAGLDDARAARRTPARVYQPRVAEPSWERIDRSRLRHHVTTPAIPLTISTPEEAGR